MEAVLYFLLGMLALGVAVAIYRVYRQTGFTEEGWRQIRTIVYQAIERGMEIYRTSQTSLEAVIDLVTDLIYQDIQHAPLPEEDKRFWTRERIRALVKPVLEELAGDADQS